MVTIVILHLQLVHHCDHGHILITISTVSDHGHTLIMISTVSDHGHHCDYSAIQQQEKLEVGEYTSRS